MKAKTKRNLIAWALYLGIICAMVFGFHGEWGYKQLTAFWLVIVMVVALALKSYQDGLKHGIDIVKEVWGIK